MTKDPVCVQAADSLGHARALMRDRRFRAFPVLEDGKLVGIISRGDILKVTSNKTNLLAGGVMTSNLVTASPDEDLFSAAKKMISAQVRQLPVLSGGEMVGLMSAVDILVAFTENDYSPRKKTLGEVMTKDVVYCTPEDELAGMWDKMQSSGLSGFPVVLKKKVVGMLTRGDILREGSVRLSKESGKAKTVHVNKAMKTPAVVIRSSASTEEAARSMVENRIIRLPVVDEKGHLQGIVDIEDILRAYSE